ncbi:2,5-diamino-6-(ribosylamino)-4(3H)-pyrimidinone 5'-phosphate reductase [Haloarchaeobius sp. TZWWS8]|uniref:2,5-diamino-6-(ribosylamino)-4(3H)-pyrimidinone 5'-phosphate reductase n=1 Tax=Haloarchaeobius sp. TZWWS8 TaxID=3446121 RepID=UPI003EBD3C5D
MYVHVNAAMSADGKLAARTREQLKISGSQDFERVDHIRAQNDGVMVGVGTVLADDPSLTVDASERLDKREAQGLSRQPARIVADSRARTPTDARILDESAETYVLVGSAAPDDRVEALEAAGATVVVAGDERVDLGEALNSLETHGIERLMVEGGGELIFSLFEAGLVDEMTVYVGALVVGGRDAPTLADGEGFVDDFPELDLEGIDAMDDGVLLRWKVL